MLQMSRWVSLAILAIGCGSSAPAPQTTASPSASSSVPADAAVEARPPLADDLPRLALRARQLYLDWQVAFADANTDCPTATASMNALADKNADVIVANQQVMRDGHEKRKALRAEVEKYEAEMAPVAKAIIESPIMSRCASDPAFSKAVDRLAGEG
jgi:hypothetical protein